MKNIYKVIIGVVVVILVVMAFSFRSATGVKVGAVLPLTGGLASVGEDMKNGMALAMAETGLKVEFQDGEANPQKSLTAARQLVDINKASIILTAFRGASLSIASGLNNTDTVVFSTTATAEGKSISTSTPNLFVMGSEIVKSAEIPGAYARENNLCKTVSLISEQTDVGKDKLKGFSSKVGVEKIILQEFFDPATTDFKSLIAKLKEKNSDCLFVEIKSNTLSVFLKQLADSGYKPQIFSTSYSVTPGVFASAPKEMLSKVIFSSTLVDEKNPLTKSFLDKYQAKYGKEATDFSAVGYEMIKMLSKATEACGDNKACIKGELAKISNLDTTLGQLTMESNQEIQLKEYRLFKITDGKFVPVN
jgi:branched-chain amino acid transport system substrate-binding protein